MKWNLKRILSLLLVVCMLMAEVPASVFAVAPQSGSASNSQSSTQNETSSQSNTDTNNVKIVYSMYVQKHNPSLSVANGASMKGIKLADTNNSWGHASYAGYELKWNQNGFGQFKCERAGRFNA